MRLIILIFSIFLLDSCQKRFNNETSKFNLQKDIFNFSDKLENGDTLIIVADLSVCLVEGKEKIILFKKNNEIFVTTSISSNLIENDTQLRTIVYHLSENDSLNFEDLFKYIKSKGIQDRQTNSEIFRVNYKNQNISYYSDGLTDKITIGEYYSRIMRRIYPEVYFYQPPKMIEFVPPNIKSETSDSLEMDLEILDK